MRNPRRDMLFVSLAGPATNFLLMVVAGARRARRCSTRRRSRPAFTYDDLPLGIQILFSFAVVNLFLGLFNLLPIPPLDGSALIERVLPGHGSRSWYKFRPYGFLVLFLLVFSTGFVIAKFLDPFDEPARRLVRVRDEARAPLGPLRAGAVAGSPRADDVAWVESVLTPAGVRAVSAASRTTTAPHDRRRPRRAGAARRHAYADDPRWLSAALLHDIGKLDARLGVYGRVVATVSGAAAGREHAEAWSETSGFTRRVGLYLRHPELGADRIRLAGEPEEAARWAAAHHDPGTWDDARHPRRRSIVALDAADND